MVSRLIEIKTWDSDEKKIIAVNVLNGSSGGSLINKKDHTSFFLEVNVAGVIQSFNAQSFDFSREKMELSIIHVIKDRPQVSELINVSQVSIFTLEDRIILDVS